MSEKGQLNAFVRRVAWFLGSLVCFGILFYWWNQKLFQEYKPVLPEDAYIASCGASLSMYSLSDSIIPGFINLSQEGRTGLSAYKSFQMVHQNNPQVQFFVFDFSVIGTVGYRDFSFLIPAFANMQFQQTYPIADFSDLSNYPLHPKYYLINLMNKECVPNIHYLRKIVSNEERAVDTDFPYLGQFDPKAFARNNWNPEAWNKRIEKFQWLSGEAHPLSTSDLSYMDSIFNYAIREKLSIILYSGPIHKDIYPLIPEVYWNAFDKVVETARSNDIFYVIDMTKLELPDSGYINFTHVNTSGAVLVSRAFRDSLNAAGIYKELGLDLPNRYN
jgi:hypothetical protein